MNIAYCPSMDTETIQIRDIPAEDVRTLRARAQDKKNLPLSQYLRDLIHESASRPEMTEILKRISKRTRIELDTDEIRSFIDEGRR